MALKDIKARLADRVQSVTGTAKVYPRLRMIIDADDVDQLKDGDGRVNCWMVAHESTQTRDNDVNQASITRRDQFVIHGFYAARDAEAGADGSEEEFDVLVDTVLDAVNLDRKPIGQGTKLNGTIVAGETPQVRLKDLRHFGPEQVLCHHAEITIVGIRDQQT